MNKTIITIAIALLMLGIPASAKIAPSEEAKDEIQEEIGINNIECPLGAGVNPLAIGTSVSSSLPSVFGASCEFAVTAPASPDAVVLTLSGLQSDFDLYTLLNGIPTVSVWNCRPYSGGTTGETCATMVNPGDFVGVMVRRYSGSGTFTLAASVPTLLENGVPVTANVGPAAMKLFKLIVPEGAAHANIAMAGDPSASVCGVSAPLCRTLARPDADLYVRKGLLPTTALFNCRPYTYGNDESCTFSDDVLAQTGANPSPLGGNHVKAFAGPGTYFVGVRGAVGTSDVVLQGVTQ